MEVAAAQAGVISARQMDRLGVTSGRRRALLRGGIVEPAGRGAFRLAGSDPSWQQECWKALCLAGAPAFLYRRSAARVWSLDGFGEGDPVEIGVPSARRPRVQPVSRVANLRPGDIARVGGFPVTSPLRTLVDLGTAVDADLLERALESALRRHLVALDDLARLSAVPNPRLRTLRTVLARRSDGSPPTESDAETLFVILARRIGLPDPTRQYQVVLGGRRYRIDTAWPALRLAVEVDGAAVHGPSAFEADVARQNLIVLDGWLLLRFSWYALVCEPRRVERQLLDAWRIQEMYRRI